MENILYNDLIRRGMNVDVGVMEYNTKDADGKYRFLDLLEDLLKDTEYTSISVNN